MSQLVECVPNFSEGKNQEVIDAISRAVAQTPGCVLLDVDSGPSTNRTVYTFVGRPEDVVEGALNAARAAYQLIDMSRHHGEHPRMGALDVCPFIPVRGVTMDECVRCAQAFGQRLAEELGVPVYLYGEAARTAGRQSLPALRAGEYEALPEKLKQAEWAPDFGPSAFVPSWGATVAGARKFLLAFNINLLSTREQAHRIALDLREQGRGKDQPGRLKKVQAIGWYLDEKNLAQVSTNLLDFEVTGLHTVFEETCREAQELSLPVVGSQLVGLVPLKALLDAAAFYCEKENLFLLQDEHRIRLVVNRLGLDSLAPFKPKERIIEYLVPEAGPEQSLLHKPLRTFVREVGSRSAAPGGGSVAAATAAMGAALASMVGLMTYGRRQFEHLDATMRRLIPPFHAASAKLTSLVDADARAFEAYLVRVHTAPRPPAKQPQRERGLWTERSLGRVTEEGPEGRAGSLPSAPASRLGRAEPSGVGTGRGGRGEGHLPQAWPGPVPPGPALSESPEGPAPRPSGAGAGQGPQKSSGPGKGGSRNLPREMLGVTSQRSERTVQPPAERATAELGPSSEAGRAGG